MISSRGQGCGKCGKAEAFFAKAFPSSLWKSSRRNCRTPPGSGERKAQGQGGRVGHADGPFKKIASLGSAAEKRRYIDHHREELGSISKACQVAGLPSSTFYYKPDKQHRKRRDDEDEKLRQLIERIHEEFPGYGYRRVKRELKRRGHKVKEKRVRRVMKKFGLKAIT